MTKAKKLKAKEIKPKKERSYDEIIDGIVFRSFVNATKYDPDNPSSRKDAFVRLDLIKTVHDLDILNYNNDENYCVMFTYKDESYVVALPKDILVTACIKDKNSQ